MDEQKEEGRIERLKKALYGQSTKAFRQKRFELHQHEAGARDDDAWQTKDKKEVLTSFKASSHMSFWKKFFITSAIFFIGAVAVAAFVFLGKSNLVSTKNVDILVSGPIAAPAGEEI